MATTQKVKKTISSEYGLDGYGCHQPVPETWPKQPILPEINILTGIEVEVEKVSQYAGKIANKLAEVWSAKEDHSLRNFGIEFVTRGAIESQYVVPAFDKLIQRIKEYTTEYDFSPRTSIHLHLNVLDKTPKQVDNIILLYLLFERSIFKFVSPLRKKSIFCIPLQDTRQTRNLVEKGVQYCMPEWNKYSSLNILPMREQGSIEFRHLEGTDNIDKFSQWYNIILKLVKFACDSDDTLYKRICDLNTTSQYLGFAFNVFGHTWDELYQDTQVTQDMVKGIKYLKSLNHASLLSVEYLNSHSFFVFYAKYYKNKGRTTFATINQHDESVETVQIPPPAGENGQLTWVNFPLPPTE